MASQLPFYAWTPPWLRDLSIISLLVLQSFVFGLSSSMLPELTSELGTLAENVKFIIQANAIGFLCTLPLYYRLRSFLRKKDLLLGTLVLQLGLTGVAGQLASLPLLCALNFGIGFTKCIVTLDMIGLLMARFNPANNRAMFYGLYYSLGKPVALLADLSLAWLIHAYNWHYVVWLSMPAVLVSITITALVFHGQRLAPKIPLAKLDWTGALLLTLTCILLTFITDFGRYFDWFNSPIIWLSTVMLLFISGLFIYREFTQPEPYWNLNVLGQYPQVRLGVILMLILCVFFYSSSLARQFALSLVDRDEWYLWRLTLTTLLAYCLSFPVCGWLLFRRVSYRMLLTVGFGCYALSYAYIIFVIAPGSSPSVLNPFYFLQGVAYGLILTTLSTFASSNIDAADNPHRAFASVAARSVIGLVTVGSLWDNAVYRRVAVNRNDLLSRLTADNSALMQQIQRYAKQFTQQGMDLQRAQTAADQLIYKRVDAQAMLLADKDLFISLLASSILVLLAIPFLRSLEMHNRPQEGEYPLV